MATQESPSLNGLPSNARQVDQQSIAAVAVAEEPPAPPIFNLVNDCCYAILDCLPLKDLRSFGRTCKWAQQVASDFFKMNHSVMKMYASPDVFYLKNLLHLHIHDRYFQPYRAIEEHCSQSIKQIQLECTTLTRAKVDCLKSVLRTVERVKIQDCSVDGDLHENFLEFCANMKVLCVRSELKNHRDSNPDHVLIGADNAWLTRTYPTLEHLRLIHKDAHEIDELKIFFNQNPNVRRFATNSEFLIKNVKVFTTTDIKLDRLAIRFDGNNLSTVCNILGFLHDRGVFQRLDWFTKSVPHQVSQVTPLNALEKLMVNFWSPGDCMYLSPLLIDIKELSIRYTLNGSDMEMTARNLTNLERVYLGDPTPIAIASFIGHSAKLTKIKVGHGFKIWKSIKGRLDIEAWNKERAKLAGARKVTVYVDEDIYLATKWTSDKRDYNLIELKRANSYDWDDDFIF